MSIEISIQPGQKYYPNNTSVVPQTADGFDTNPMRALQISTGCEGVTFPGITPTGITSERLYLLHDDNPIFLTSEPFTSGNFDPLEAKLTNVSIALDESIGTATIDFPDKTFGSHLEPFCIPIKIVAGDPSSATDNMLFRGFMVGENASVSESDDSFGTNAKDYKWAFSKLGKFRGKVYTTSQTIAPYMTNDRENGGGSPTIFTDKRKYERFRYRIGNNNVRSGYDSSARTVFNAEGKPDCATDGYKGDYVVFKAEALRDLSSISAEPSYYWNYASILYYIVRYGIQPYTKVGTVEITGLDQIIEFPSKLKAYIAEVNPTSNLADAIDENYIRPANFEINGMNPLEAVDKTIKAIPGDWHWDLIYHEEVVEIRIINKTKGIEQEEEGKVLTLGTNQKLADGDNTANVASVSVSRDVTERFSHSVGIGAAVELETTIELYPAWTRYVATKTSGSIADVRWDKNAGEFVVTNIPLDVIAPTEEVYTGQTLSAGQIISDFKSQDDYDQWVAWMKGSEKLSLTSPTIARYESIYRKYNTYPGSLNEARQALQLVNPYFNVNITSAVTAQDGNAWPSKLDTYYDDLITGNEMSSMILSFINKERKIGGVKTKINMGKTATNTGLSGTTNTELDNYDLDDKPFVFMYDSLRSTANFNAAQGTLTTSQIDTLSEGKSWIVPDFEGIDYSFGQSNRSVTFSKPMYNRKREISGNEKEQTAWYPSTPTDISTRKIFMTCTLGTDTNLAIDYLNEQRLSKFNNLNLIGYNVDDSNNVIIRVGSVLPKPIGESGHTLNYDSGLSVNTQLLDDNSALVDWNAFSFQFGGNNAGINKFVVENVNDFLQTTIDMVDGTTYYKEDINVDLGRLDLSVRPGDTIKEIRNSEDENGEGGYYNLDSYVITMNVNKEGEADSYTVTVDVQNRESGNSITQSVRNK